MWVDLSIAGQAATIAGAIVGLATFVRLTFEYTRNNSLKRAEHFYFLRERIYGGEGFNDLIDLLEFDSDELIRIDSGVKHDFLGLFEELAISVKSKLIRKDVAYYMFGYYAIRCLESEKFWDGMNKDSLYWKLFSDFAHEMQAIEKYGRIEPRNLKF